jgi:hypothetical protein
MTQAVASSKASRGMCGGPETWPRTGTAGSYLRRPAAGIVGYLDRGAALTLGTELVGPSRCASRCRIGVR